MEHTMAKVTLHSPDMSRSEQIELLVDTGSTYTWVSNVMLEKLNVKAKTTRKFKTIDGRLLERKIGEVIMEHMNEKATRMVVFADKGDAQVLGVDALEGLGLEVDPITKQLKKAEALLAL
jgi:clan AA aspartic protease